MQKQSGFIVLSVLLTLAVHAQPKMNLPEVDSVSYVLFREGEWKELVQYSEQARKQGIDFFYLKARTGIALYNLKKYRAASEWFLKAWNTDKSFEWLQEYLYYSLLWGGRGYEASKLAADFSPGIKQKTGYSARKITGAALEAGYTVNTSFNSLKAANHGQQAGVGGNYGEAFYLKNYHFESLDLSHRVFPSLSINHNFTFLGINREQLTEWGNRNSFSSKTNQFQYYFNPILVLGNIWHIAPSINLIWGDFFYQSAGFINNNRIFNKTDYNFRDHVFSFTAWTHTGIFSPGAEYNYGNISNTGFNQYSIWVTTYPFSNLNFYFTPRIYFKSNGENSIGYNAFGFSGDLQAGPVHLYSQYLNGNMENFIESAGYVVSNFPGTSKQKFSGSLYFPADTKYKFVIRYILQDVTETYRIYSGGIQTGTLNYSFNKQTFTAGILWHF